MERVPVYNMCDEIIGGRSEADIAADIEKTICSLPHDEKVGMRLRLAARLCENGAFNAANIWPADKVAAAVVLAAQIERLLTPDNA